MTIFALIGVDDAMAQPAECGGRMVRLSPIRETHTMPPYPAISQRMGEQGESVLRLVVDWEGKVQDASVLRSSGSARLDQAAMTHIRARWRYQGSSACSGAVTQVTVTWRLLDASHPQ